MFVNSSNSSGVMQESATFTIFLLWPSSSNKQSMPHETYSPYEVSKGVMINQKHHLVLVFCYSGSGSTI